MEKEDDLKFFTAMTEMRDHLKDSQVDVNRNLKFKEEKDSSRKFNKKSRNNIKMKKSDTRLSVSSDETKYDFRLPI